MSRAKEYADKMCKIAEMRRSIAEPPSPGEFAIRWPGGGKVVARVEKSGSLDLTGGEISPEEALQLRDWITEMYGEENEATRSVAFKKAIADIKKASDPSERYSSLNDRYDALRSALGLTIPYLSRGSSVPLEGPQWLPVSSHSGEFTDGERFLVAVEVADKNMSKTHWECHIIRVMCCSETPVDFVTDVDNEYFTEWHWEDLDYYVPLGRDDDSQYRGMET